MNRLATSITALILLAGCSWGGSSPDKIELCKKGKEGVFCQKQGTDPKENTLSCAQYAGTIRCNDANVQSLADPREKSAIEIEMDKNAKRRGLQDLFK